MRPLKFRSLALPLAFVVASVVSACSTQDPGRATTPTQATEETTETTASSKRPSNAPDLDLGEFADSPCDLLKPEQLSGLGEFEAPERKDGAAGTYCRWGARDVLKGSAYRITIPPSGQDIESIADNAKDSPIFNDRQVAGYRAVSYDITDGKGTCTTAVAVSSESAFIVQVTNENEESPEWRDSCGASEKVAAMVIENLKG